MSFFRTNARTAFLRFKTYWKTGHPIQFMKTTAQEVVQVVAFFHVFTYYIGNMTICVGPSMIPTINPKGELVLIDIMSFKLLNRPYQVGDVVIVISPTDPHKTICKRVKAIEGETLVFFPKNSIMPQMIRIPQGNVWLLGDNPSNSRDSRDYGPVPVGLIMGKAVGKFDFATWQFGSMAAKSIPIKPDKPDSSKNSQSKGDFNDSNNQSSETKRTNNSVSDNPVNSTKEPSVGKESE